MARLIEVEGKTHEFPDDATDDEINLALQQAAAPPGWGSVMQAVPGEAKRHFMSTMAGAQRAAGDALNMPEWQQQSHAVKAELAKERALEVPENLTILQEGVLSGGASALGMLPAMAVTGPVAATRGAAAAIGPLTTIMGAQTGFSRYGDLRSAGFEPGRASLHAAFEGLVEKYTEFLPMRMFDAKGPLAREFLRYMTREMGGEQVATLLQDVSAKLSDQPDMTLGDYLRDVLVTAVATPVAGALQGGALTLASAATAPFSPEPPANPPAPGSAPLPVPSNPPPPGGAVVPNAGVAPAPDLTPPVVPPLPTEQLTAAAQGVADVVAELAPGTPQIPNDGGYINSAGEFTPLAPDNIRPMTNDPTRYRIFPGEGTLLMYLPDVGRTPERQATDERWADMQQAAQHAAARFGIPVQMVLERRVATQMPAQPAPQERNNSAQGNTVPVDSESFKATEITFPNAATKALWNFGVALTRAQNTKKPPSVSTLNNLRDRAKEATGIADDAEVTDTAARYVYGVSLSGAKDTPGTFNAPDVEVALNRQKRHEESIVGGLAASAPEGQVVFARSAGGETVRQTAWMKTAQAYLQSWVKRFSPKMRVVIVATQDSEPQVRAKTYYYGGVHFVYIPREPITSADRALALYVLSHEFGHMIINQHLNNPQYSEQYDALVAEYSRFASRASSMSAMQYVREGRSPIDLISGDAMTVSSAVDYLGSFSPSYGSFDEWLADQMVRYMHTERELLQIPEQRGFWQKLFDDLKAFFDKVVKKFEPSATFRNWVESLATQDSSLVSVSPNVRVDYSKESQELEANFRYTTRVLDRLPKKPSVKKVTIYGELGRADVREQERRLIGEVLKDIPGESVDRLLFVREVMQHVIPLRLKESDSWKGYGLEKIGARDLFESTTAKTHLYESDAIRHADTRHFSSRESDRLVGHSRGFGDGDTWLVLEFQSDYLQSQATDDHRQAAGEPERVRTWSPAEIATMERRADDAAAERDVLERALEPLQRYVTVEGMTKTLSILYERYGTPHLDVRYSEEAPVTRAILLLQAALSQTNPRGARPGVITVQGSPNVWADQPTAGLDVRKRLREALEHAQLEAQESRASAERMRSDNEAAESQTKTEPAARTKFSERWAELFLRHEIAWAAAQGFKKLRVATPNTVARVENWGSVGDLLRVSNRQWRAETKKLLDNEVIELRAFRARPGWNETDSSFTRTAQGGQVFEWRGLARRDSTGRLFLSGYTPEGGRIEAPFDSSNAETTLPARILQKLAELGSVSYHYTAERSLRDEIPSRQQIIFDRYADQVARPAKGEFKGKLVSTEYGGVPATWYEIELNAALADMPIQYYNLARAAEETGNQIAARMGVPEMPESFQRFENFLLYTLQLNQVAKLLPNVMGLQQYRKAMRALHAFKAKLFEGPNERIRQWHGLGWKIAREVEQALTAEFRQGEHWTQLQQVEIDDNKGGKRQVWVHLPDAGFEQLMKDRGVTPEGIDLFLGVKNDNLQVLQAMEDVVEKHLRAAFATNPMVLTNRLNALHAEIKRLRETPFLPEMRFGKYTVAVRAGKNENVDGRDIKKGELVYWEKFENERTRDRRFAELKKDLKGTEHVVSAGYDSDTVSQLRGMPRNVVQAVIEMLNSNENTRLTQEQMDSLAEVEFDQTQAGRFAKYLGTPAKHLAGASKELRRSYAAYHWKIANAIAKLQYYRELTGSLADVRRDIETVKRLGGKTDSYDKLLGYLQSNLQYVMQPQHEFEQLRMFASLWYLWGSTKTAVMNMTSVPILTFPYLWDRFGMLNAQASMLRAMKDVVQYWRDPSKLSPDRQHVLKQLKEDGSTDQSFASMLASVADGGVAFERMIPNFEFAGESTNVIRRTAWQVTALGMLPFRVVEQMNRQVTGLAAYDLMSKKLGKTLSQGDVEAYNFARDTIDYTQNEYGAWNRPKLLQGKKSIFLLFFSFVQNMSFLMFGGDKSWWKAMLVLAAFGGLQGLPGMDNLIDMFNWALRKMTGQFVDLRLEAREVAKELGMNPDLVMHGVSHNWLGLGWSTSSSIGQGRIIPGTDAIFGIGRFEQRFVSAAGEIGGPVGSMMLGWLQAMADENPNVFSRWDRALPPVIRNLERTWEAYERDVWVNTRGRPLADSPTSPELLGQALGFAPTRRTERQEELRAAHDITEYYTQRRTNLMEMYFNAKRTRDSTTIGEVRERIRQFNADVPSPKLKISSEDLGRSLRSRERLEEETRQFQSPIRRYREIYRYIDGLY